MQLFESQLQKSSFLRTPALIFCLPWGRRCGNHAKRCMNEKTIQCLPNPSQYVPIYLQHFPVIRTASAKNRRFHVPQPTFLFTLETSLRLSRNMLHGWKDNLVLAKSLAWTLLKADERRLEAFHMNCQRRILGISWFHVVTNASVTSQTGEEDLAIRICRRRLSIFGHVRRLPEATPAHSALRLAVDARTDGKPNTRPESKRQRGRPCRTWVQQIEDDTGLNGNDAWRIAHDRKSWRALRPVAGQAFH